MPSGLPLDVARVDRELARRQRGHGRGGRMKIEQDRIELLSGTRAGVTLGSPIAFTLANRDATIEREAERWMNDPYEHFGYHNTKIHSLPREEVEAEVAAEREGAARQAQEGG